MAKGDAHPFARIAGRVYEVAALLSIQILHRANNACVILSNEKAAIEAKTFHCGQTTTNLVIGRKGDTGKAKPRRSEHGHWLDQSCWALRFG